MRNQQNKRMRGRNRKSHNPLTRVYESNGPDVKIRGTASHIAEKYVQLARDAQSSGDPVSAENYLQHAEHYFRLIATAQEQFRQTTPFFRGEGGMDGRDETRDDISDDGDDEPVGLPGGAEQQPSFGPRDPQPYLPRDAQFFQPREQQSFGGRHLQHAAPKGSDDDSNVERLPSFITGGAPAPQIASQPAHQGYGQNGFEGQSDRFPLHRRRRRHRGPRGDLAQGGPSDSVDVPQGPRQSGE